MPTICDLRGIRCTLAHTVRIGTGSVAGHDLNPRMLAQPRCQGFGLPVGQKINHRVAFQIDQDGPVSLSAAPRPIVNGKNPRR
jgi:hypothetical protein